MAYYRRNDEKLVQENYILKRKLLEMEAEKGTFGSLYAELLEDFQNVVEENKNCKDVIEQLQSDVQTLQNTVNNITMRSDVSNNSFNESYRASKIEELINRRPQLSRSSPSSNSNGKPNFNKSQDSHSKTKCHEKSSFLTLGLTTRTLQQQNRLRELVCRSQARLQAIQTASVRRARITVQMKNLVIYELNNSEYFDTSTYDALHARLKEIEAFPFEQMRNDTIRRLAHFGYFEKAKKEQLEKFDRAVRAIITQAMAESHRRRFINDVGTKNLRLENYRKRIVD